MIFRPRFPISRLAEKDKKRPASGVMGMPAVGSTPAQMGVLRSAGVSHTDEDCSRIAQNARIVDQYASSNSPRIINMIIL